MLADAFVILIIKSFMRAGVTWCMSQGVLVMIGVAVIRSLRVVVLAGVPVIPIQVLVCVRADALVTHNQGVLVMIGVVVIHSLGVSVCQEVLVKLICSLIREGFYFNEKVFFACD